MTSASVDLAKIDTGQIPRIPRVRSSQRRRNIELGLLVIASVLSAIAVGLVQMATMGAVHGGIFALAAIIVILVLLLHIVLRFVAPSADPLIMPIAVMLNGIGIAEIYRIDLALNNVGWDSLAIRQIAWTALALAAAFIVILTMRSPRSLQRYTYTSGLAAVILLLLPMVPGLGVEVNGARVWIDIGGLTFQPGEIAKIALAVFFAGYLVQHRDSLSMVGRRVIGIRFPRGRDLGPIVAIWILSMLVIVFQRDLGTGLLYFGLFLVMLYVATARVSWVLLGIGLFAAGAIAANQFLTYVHDRFANWYDAFNQQVFDADGGSYQLVQGLFGMGHGGLIGTGLGQGMPYITPVSQSDYIVASVAEELGLVGLFALLCLYVLLVSRGVRIGFAATDDFSKLLSVGLASVIALQTFLVVGGVTRIIPLTGLTTPFLAAGG
ncbi:MAG: cell division protein FtsW, partial [Actinobacteria bacterium]|nr:cell division protein FtsW [Actinomycetota bacterium]